MAVWNGKMHSPPPPPPWFVLVGIYSGAPLHMCGSGRKRVKAREREFNRTSSNNNSGNGISDSSRIKSCVFHFFFAQKLKKTQFTCPDCIDISNK